MLRSCIPAGISTAEHLVRISSKLSITGATNMPRVWSQFLPERMNLCHTTRNFSKLARKWEVAGGRDGILQKNEEEKEGKSEDEKTDGSRGRPSNSEAQEKRLNQLLKWMKKNRIAYDSSKIVLEMEGGDTDGVRVAAKVDIRASSDFPIEVARIPLAACITVENVPAVAKRVENFGLEDPEEALAAAVMHEMVLGIRSQWYEYLSSLPDDGEPIPIMWPTSIIEALEGTGIAPRLVRDRERLMLHWKLKVYPLLCDALGHTMEKMDSSLGMKIFFQAMSFVSSRALPIEVDQTLGLAPLLDLFNHKGGVQPGSGDGPVKYAHAGNGRWDEEKKVNEDEEGDVPQRDRVGMKGLQEEMSWQRYNDDKITIVIVQPVKQGREIFAQYLSMWGNLEMLVSHGFAVPGNVFDKVEVGPLVENAVSVLGERTVQGRTQWLKGLAESDLKPGSRELSAVKGALSAAKYGFVVKRWHGARVSRGALRFVGVCALPEEEFARLSRESAYSAALWLELLDEIDVYCHGDGGILLLEAMEQRLCKYPSPPKKVTSGYPHKARAVKMCSLVVEGEKELLRMAMQRIRG